jgi:uncharacterized integral membrane protein (TIGR00697 family)
MNETLWLAFALLDLTMVLVVFRLFGRVGLFGLIVLNLVLCNIQVLKVIELFGFTTTLGNVLYASVFLSTDLLSEFYGKQEARRGVLLGFAALVLGTLYMQIALLFTPAADDFAQGPLSTIFSFQLRVVLASLVAYLASQLHDVWAFHLLKQKTGGRYLWLRNNVSTMVSQLIDTALFCSIAFIGVFPPAVFWDILLTTYVVKVLVAGLDTPFIYLAKRLFSRSGEATAEAC